MKLAILQGAAREDPNAPEFHPPIPQRQALFIPTQAIILSSLQHRTFPRESRTASHCAQRTSTVSSCTFCSKKDGLVTPYPTLLSTALREHGDRPSYPTSFFSILLYIWNLPVNRSQPGIGKVSVDVREAPASEKLSDRQG